MEKVKSSESDDPVTEVPEPVAPDPEVPEKPRRRTFCAIQAPDSPGGGGLREPGRNWLSSASGRALPVPLDGMATAAGRGDLERSEVSEAWSQNQG